MSNFSGKCDLYDHLGMERSYRVYKPGSFESDKELALYKVLADNSIAPDVDARLRKEFPSISSDNILVPTSIIHKFINSYTGTGKDFNSEVYSEMDSKFSGFSISDELECFEILKKRTNGVIHQHVKLKLTDYNIDAEIKKVNNPNILSKIEFKDIIEDKRLKNGKKEKISYYYKYWNKEYKSLKELNSKHYYTTIDIPINTIFDLIPYYPYIISFSTSSPDSEYIVVSNQSYVDDQIKDYLEFGSNIDFLNSYKADLQMHYFELSKDIINYVDNCPHYAHMKAACEICDKSFCAYCNKNIQNQSK